MRTCDGLRLGGRGADEAVCALLSGPAWLASSGDDAAAAPVDGAGGAPLVLCCSSRLPFQPRASGPGSCTPALAIVPPSACWELFSVTGASEEAVAAPLTRVSSAWLIPRDPMGPCRWLDARRSSSQR